MTTPAFLLSLLLSGSLALADTFAPFPAGKVPKTVADLWATVDPTAEPLDVEIVKEWKEDGITTRYVLFTVCTHQDTPSRIAAFYTFPDGGKKLPAFVWAHGGGQRADRGRGRYFAKRGYATIDINWNGREIVEGIEKNTDWGKLDPTQGPQFYPKALRPHFKNNLEPDEHSIDQVPSPRNADYFLLALAGRRAVTFLEQQAEVDPERIGFTGYSMGGTITSYCAIDSRLKAVAPMVGGTGFRTRASPGHPGSSWVRRYKNPALFAATMDSSAYWPLVRCPVLFLNASNDFHGIFEDSYRCTALLPHDNWAASYNLHFNHSLRSEQWAALNVFFDHHLKGAGPGLPKPAKATLQHTSGHNSATLTVTPDPARQAELVSIEILYSHDPNPRSRFWKTLKAGPPAETTTAELPVRPNLPLLAFANLTYRLPEPMSAFEDNKQATGTFTLTSELASLDTGAVKLETLRAGATHNPVFHDFTVDGLTGWGSSSRRSRITTYRLQDPTRAFPPADATMRIQFGKIEAPMVLVLRVSRNEWLLNGKKKSSFTAVRTLAPGTTTIAVKPADFKDPDKATLDNWEEITTFSLELAHQKPRQTIDLTRPENLGIIQKIIWE